ncbi:hypothetical protein K438DRAFT_861232 [Mycena galopus ATCC 62051]|nr:hypothetical protein K438DRAFT_861232 [Mycena galopus ATCC 62051]
MYDNAFTNVSPRQQHCIMKLWRKTSQVKTAPNGPQLKGRPRALSSDKFLQNSVDRTCDTYLDEFQESLGAICGAEASQATIWQTLRRSGYRMKKLTRKAIEHSVRKRAAYTFEIGLKYSSEQLVFVDESAADRRTTYQGYAWAFSGNCAV